MPAPVSVAEFANLVRKSQLIEPTKFDAYFNQHASANESPSEFARKLTAAGMLTRYQADQLLRGKHRGFVLGKYRLLEKIGTGGMGQVFLAEHTSMKRRVAIKVLPPEMATNEFSRERFLREARAAGQLDHPNLVRAFDVDAEGEVVYLVMEYIDGISLHDLVTRFGPLDPARAAYYLWQAAVGLDYVHAAGLVHRDIKPANLLLDRSGTVKILDLGLVRSQFEDNDLTRGQGVKILGTADFLAPEQAINCSTVDIRADIYSLGATGYFLLTGKLPYPGEKVAQKLIAHQVMPIPRASDSRPEVPVELSDVVVKMMGKKPGDRYALPSEVVVSLEVWARTPLPPPSEFELPGGVGAAGAGSVVGIGTRMPHPSGVNVAGPTSGSAVRYYGDSGVRMGLTGPSSGQLLPLAPLTPVSATRVGVSGNSGQGGGAAVAVAPPILPAARTHMLTTEPLADTPLPEVFNPFRLTAEPEVVVRKEAPTAPKRGRRRAAIALAGAVTVAVAAWNVALLSGAVPRASSPSNRGTNPGKVSDPAAQPETARKSG